MSSHTSRSARGGKNEEKAGRPGGGVTAEDNGAWEPQKESKSLQVGTQWHVPVHAIRTDVDGEHGRIEAVTDHSTREGVSAAA